MKQALFETAFQNAGLPLGIEDFTIQLDRGVHKIVHGKGVGRAADWNTYWKVFIAGNPDPTTNQIIRHLKNVMADFNLL